MFLIRSCLPPKNQNRSIPDYPVFTPATMEGEPKYRCRRFSTKTGLRATHHGVFGMPQQDASSKWANAEYVHRFAAPPSTTSLSSTS
jgi:hypothetical protein